MNTAIFYFFYNLAHRSATFDAIAIFITDTFDKMVLVAAVIYLLYLFASHPHWKGKSLHVWISESFIIFASVVGAYAVSYILKIIVHAPRPFVTLVQVQPLVAETPYTSFPSGHATLFFALATAIYLYNKRAGYVFFFFALVIAISRMVVGVHYPIDILAGAVIGMVVAWGIHGLLSKIFSNSSGPR